MLRLHGSVSKALKHHPSYLLQLSQDIPYRGNCGSLKCTGRVWCRMRNIFSGCARVPVPVQVRVRCAGGWGRGWLAVTPLVSAPGRQEVPGYRDSQNIWQKIRAYLSAHANT